MDFKQKELQLRSKEYEEERKRRDEAEKRQDSMMQMFVQENQLMLSLSQNWLISSLLLFELVFFTETMFVFKFLLFK